VGSSPSRAGATAGILAATTIVVAAVVVVLTPGLARARSEALPATSPAVTVSASPGAATHGVTVTGSGWTAGHQIQVHIGSITTFGTTVTTVCTLTASSDGTIAGNQSNGSCSVPKVPAGSQPLTATDLNTPTIKATGANFTVKPALLLMPAHSTVGLPASVGTTVTIQGSGFAAGSTISTFKLGTTTLTTSPSSVTIGAAGNFLTAVTFTVPAVAAATYTLTATDSSSNTGTSVLMVYAPHVTVSSSTGTSTGASGRVVTVTGSGWPKGDLIFVQIGSSTFDASGFVVCDLTASSDGTIAGNQSSNNCTVPHTAKGTQPLVAIDDQHQGVVATSTFKVTPALELTPAHSALGSPASVGVTVSIMGRGFAAGSTVSNFKLGTTTLTTTPSSVNIGALGNFATPVTFTVPAIAAGTYTLTATDSSSNSGSSPLAVYVPHVTVSSSTGTSTGASGHGVTVTGSGWPKGDAIFVQIGSSTFDASGTVACVLTANSDGTIAGNQVSNNCTVPFVAKGTQQLVGIDDQNQGVVANSAFAVTPGLVLTPPHNLQVGSPVVPGETISILGHGYAAGSTVSNFTFNGSPVTTSPSSVSIGALGNFTTPVTFTVPAIGAGTYSVKATDSSSNFGSSPLIVYVPHISVSPTSGPAGRGLTVTGSGWPAGDFIFVQIGPQASIFDDDVVCALTASSDGTIVGNSCSVPSVATGSQPLVAIDDQNQDVIANGASFTVTS
jgi:IPT/TIG domain